jgi:hypothetical protein
MKGQGSVYELSRRPISLKTEENQLAIAQAVVQSPHK